MARRLVVTACVFLVAAAGIPGGQRSQLGASAAGTDSRPNFVVIITDDQRWDTIGRCLGGFDGSDLAAGANSCMPLLQQDLIANGATFLRGEVDQSLCCPSRASILTGQWTSHTHVVSVSGFDEFDDTSTVATWLHDAGYRTGLVGKYLNGYGDSTKVPSDYVPPGWDAWHAYYGFSGVTEDPYTNYTWIDWEAGGTPVHAKHLLSQSTSNGMCAVGNLYSTDLICSLSLAFLRADATRPFFLYVAPASPHEPPIPADRWNGLYQSVSTPTYPNYNVVPTPNPPSYLPTAPLSDAALTASANSFRNALATNRAADDMVGAIYDELRADGRLSNTVFIFMSDNGLAAGQQRWTSKQCEFEACHRVPFIMVCPPAVCPGALPGRVDADHFVLNVDIAPTVAHLAGVTPSLRVDGSSLAPLLDNPAAPWRTWWLLHEQGPVRDGIVATAADGDVYKYVSFPETGETELFDLTTDPWELANLVGDGTHNAVQAVLAARLQDATTSPAVSILGGPGSATNKTTVSFSFASSEPASFECALDAGPVQPCGSGTTGATTLAGLAPGMHTFSVRGVDGYNNVSTPATQPFTVDATPPPVPSLTQTPPDPSGSSATFSFTDTEASVTFSCSLDGQAPAPCTSPTTYTGLASGTHTFSVAAVDGASNASVAAIFPWTVSGGPSPTVTLRRPAADALQTRTLIRVSWSGSSGIVRFDVYERVGVGGTQQLVQSSSATSFRRTGVPGTTYCYQVRGVDGSGNVGQSEERCAAIPLDDASPLISYVGPVARISAAGAFVSTLTVLNGSGQEADFGFTGRRVGLLVRLTPASGQAAIWLDGVQVSTVDLYSSSNQDLVYLFTSAVPLGPHTLRVVWTGARNPSSSGTGVSVDGIAVIG